MISSGFFEYCCGAMEVGDLSGTAGAIAKNVRTLIEQYKNEVSDGYTDQAPGMLVATTIPAQRGAITALRGLKFKKVSTFTNPGTGNKVTLWAKKLTY